MLIIILITIIIAGVTGILSGLLGVGGNIIAIPLLTLVFTHLFNFNQEVAIHLAIGSGVLVMVFTTLSSSYYHYKNDNIIWGFYKPIAPTMIVGVIIGAQSMLLINGVILEKIFAIFLLLVSLKLAYTKFCHAHKILVQNYQFLPKKYALILGFIIGFKSGLLGIGGGIIIIPLLIFLRYSGSKISGTTALCSLTMALASSFSYLINALHIDYQIKYTLGNIYVPIVLIMIPFCIYGAKFGVKLSLKLSSNFLSYIQLLVILLLGLQMLI